jgi:hypothetical protein
MNGYESTFHYYFVSLCTIKFETRLSNIQCLRRYMFYEIVARNRIKEPTAVKLSTTEAL